MSRRRIAALLVLVAAAGSLAAPGAATAQDGATGTPPERIDLTVTSQRPPDPASEEECRRRREAAIVSGEIVVCGAGPGQDQRITSREEAQNRYATATQGRGPAPLPELGIFKGPATVSGICIPGIFNCPKPPAVFVDVTALPKAPPGSDADRISRGLAPLGEDESTIVARQTSARQREELGLPEPGSASPAPSREESAAPAVPR
jgi:hypothetical protein